MSVALTPGHWALLLAGVAAVALLYGSVGHGGASGYLAMMVLAAVPQPAMKGTALVLNLLVAGFGWWQFARAGYFVPRLLWPFAAASIPAAYLGGLTRVSGQTYDALLAVALFLAGLRLVWTGQGHAEAHRRPPVPLALVLGAGIGWLSGLVGVGGGIFLSPLLILTGWASAKETAGASAAFIVVNSMAGLAGHLQKNALPWDFVGTLLLAAFAGGALGASWGARRASPVALRRLLGVVLLLAAGKLAGGLM